MRHKKQTVYSCGCSVTHKTFIKTFLDKAFALTPTALHWGSKIWIQDYMLQVSCCVATEQFMLCIYSPSGGKPFYFNCVSDRWGGASSCLSRWFVNIYLYIYMLGLGVPQQNCTTWQDVQCLCGNYSFVRSLNSVADEVYFAICLRVVAESQYLSPLS